MTAPGALQKLVTWLSPAFPVGAFAWSAGLETAIADRRVTDSERLQSWIEGALLHGGRLVISGSPGGGGIALPAGDAIVYPANSLHRVEPVTRGARLASFFWIQSLVRDNDQRRMLFEMDTAIQKLTLDGADDDAVLQLTCVYHNLLRRWSET